MKYSMLLFVFILFFSSCSNTKNTSVTQQNGYENTYNKYLSKNEIKTFSWYQGVKSKNNKGELIIRLFYPEKEQLTSYTTYKLDDPTLKHGLYKTWFDNGFPQIEGQYKNNFKTGWWKYFNHENGSLLAEGTFKGNKHHGKWKNYDLEGRIYAESTWEKGVKEGEFIDYDTLGNIVNQGIYKADTIFQQTQKFKRIKSHQNGVVFMIVDEMPHLKEVEHITDIAERKKASDQALLKHIYGNISYPSFARENAAEGMAVIRFVIDTDGSVIDIYPLSGVCESIEKECLELVANLPPWNPGKQDGKAVRVRYNLPVRFKLN